MWFIGEPKEASPVGVSRVRILRSGVERPDCEVEESFVYDGRRIGDWRCMRSEV